MELWSVLTFFHLAWLELYVTASVWMFNEQSLEVLDKVFIFGAEYVENMEA